MPEGCDTTMMGGDLPPMDTTMMGGDLPPMDATMMDGDMMPPMPEGDRPHRHGNGTHGNGTHGHDGPHHGPNGTHGHGNGAHELPEDMTMEKLMRLSEECASVCTPMVDN
jgi:hypothetical protein